MQSTDAIRRVRRVATVLGASLAVSAMGAATASATFGGPAPLGKLDLDTPRTLVTNVGQDNKLVLQYGNHGTGAIEDLEYGCAVLSFFPSRESAILSRINYKDVRSPLIVGQNANAEYVFEGKKTGSTFVACAIKGRDVATGKWVFDTDVTEVKVNRSR